MVDDERSKKGKPEALGRLLGSALQRMGLDRQLDDYRILQGWDEVVGPAIARNAQPVKLDAQRLVVAVRTAAWLQELDLLRRELCSRLNAWMGRKVINELFLVVGRVDRGSANPKQTNDRALEQLWSALKKHEGDPPD